MINAIDLLLAENFLKFFVQLNCRFQIMAKGLFNDYAGPGTVVFLGEAGFGQFFPDRREKLWGNREIVETVAMSIVILLNCCDLLFQPLVGRGIGEVTLDVVETLGKPWPQS